MSHERLTNIDRYDHQDQEEGVDEKGVRCIRSREDRRRDPIQPQAGRDRGTRRPFVRRAPTEDGAELMFSLALQANPASGGVSCYFTSFCLI